MAVGVFWFQIQFFLALSAFWLEETWVLRVIFLIVAQFLSGAVIEAISALFFVQSRKSAESMKAFFDILHRESLIERVLPSDQPAARNNLEN